MQRMFTDWFSPVVQVVKWSLCVHSILCGQFYYRLLIIANVLQEPALGDNLLDSGVPVKLWIFSVYFKNLIFFERGKNWSWMKSGTCSCQHSDSRFHLLFASQGLEGSFRAGQFFSELMWTFLHNERDWKCCYECLSGAFSCIVYFCQYHSCDSLTRLFSKWPKLLNSTHARFCCHYRVSWLTAVSKSKFAGWNTVAITIKCGSHLKVAYQCNNRVYRVKDV